MKQKSIKKLTLNKITVSNLKDIMAGAALTTSGVPTNPGALDTKDCPTDDCLPSIDLC
jgi:hypothetical protein